MDATKDGAAPPSAIYRETLPRPGRMVTPVSMLLLLLMLPVFSAACPRDGSAAHAWTFYDPTEAPVPFPLIEGAEYDAEMSLIMTKLLRCLQPDTVHTVSVWIVDENEQVVRGFYADRFRLRYHPVHHDLASIRLTVIQNRCFEPTWTSNAIMDGDADGGISIFQPFFDLRRDRWDDRTLIMVIR